MRSNKLWQLVAWLVVIIGIGTALWLTRSQWQQSLRQPIAERNDHQHGPTSIPEERETLELNKQARENLGLVTKPVKLQSWWKKTQIPGEIIDRPGVTDQGITSPLKGVVTQVHAFEGDVVRPGEKLFSLRLASDSLQSAQSGLYKATRETEIVSTEKERIDRLIESGIVAGKRRIELQQKTNRQAALIDAYRQELEAHGLDAAQIEQIEKGNFLTTIDIKAPLETEDSDTGPLNSFFEIKQLKVDLGYQIEAGTPLAILANHQSLYIKGHAFKKEASRLASAAENSWPVELKFTDDLPEDWKEIEQEFLIRHTWPTRRIRTAALWTFLFLWKISPEFTKRQGVHLSSGDFDPDNESAF